MGEEGEKKRKCARWIVDEFVYKDKLREGLNLHRLSAARGGRRMGEGV